MTKTYRVRAKPRITEAKARYVYVIHRADGTTKIGISRNAKRRLSGLQAATPDRLTLAHVLRPTTATAFEIESAALSLLHPWRVSGEWLKCSSELAVIAIEAASFACPRRAAFIKEEWKRNSLREQWERQALEATRVRRSRVARDEKEAAELIATDAWKALRLHETTMMEQFPEFLTKIDPWAEGVDRYLSKP